MISMNTINGILSIVGHVLLCLLFGLGAAKIAGYFGASVEIRWLTFAALAAIAFVIRLVGRSDKAKTTSI
jgi:hypothetical protein